MPEPKKITTPLTDQVVESLNAGDNVLITGELYSARDAAHKRMVEMLDRGEKLPFDLKGQLIYYVGPTPARPGRVIGSAGPTTSGRMDTYAPAFIACGLRGMIGQGLRSQPVIDAMKEHGAVYFGATGGAGALLARRITSSEIVAYEDLGPEAIRKLIVEDFPVIVINDAHGGDYY